jgi:glycosyltransferase involved in cell wall biosynthesis
MEVVERLAAEADLAAVLAVRAETPHDEVLPSGVRAIGLTDIWAGKQPFDPVIARLETLRPTHLVLLLPSVDLLAWARRRGIRTLPSLADSFSPRSGLRGLLDRWRIRRLARALDHSAVERVGNHNIAAAEELAAIGVRPSKIVPWDWPRTPTPADFPAKTPPTRDRKHLVCVGSVTEAKGVGDAIRALAADPEMGGGATLDVVGDGDLEGMHRLAAELGVERRVTFAGRVPHAAVAPRMHEADAVLVYSRHAYGEGLPGTIYLGLAARTPLVVSDHPMFTTYLRDREDALVVPERTPAALAGRLRELFAEPDLYTHLSRNSEAVFKRIQHPVMWGEFIERWIRDRPEDRAWLEAQSLPHWRAARR